MNKDLILFTILFAVAVLAGGLLIYWFRRIAFSRRCPVCHETDVDRRPRKGWQRRVTFIKAYSCQECGTRFVRLSITRSTQHHQRTEPPIRLINDHIAGQKL